VSDAAKSAASIRLDQRQRARVFSTWSAQNRPTPPFEIVGGVGARFTTADGADWLDFGSMTWNANLGHGHPRMKAALAEAAGRGLLAYPSSVFPDKVRAGELLAEVTPAGLERSFICLSGAEANENAVKMARMVTGRKKVVARTRSYHGATLAMLSLSGDPRREPFEPGLPGVVRTVDPYCYRCPVGRERPPATTSAPTTWRRCWPAKGPTPSPPSSWKGSWARTACSCPRPATGARCATSAPATASC